MVQRMLRSTAWFVIACVLWTSRLNAIPWGDELYTKVVTAQPTRDMLHVVLIDAVHPPLYYVLIHAWQRAAGDSVYALRLPSVLLMVLGLAVTMRLGREIRGTRAARWMFPLIALNPFLFWYAQEMRMYAQLFTLTAMEMLLLVMALKGSRAAWIGQAVVTACLVNTHYFGFLVLLPFFAFLTVEKRWRRYLPLWLVIHAVGVATFIPWLYAWLNRDPAYIGAGWIPPLRWDDLPLTLRTFFFSGAELWPWLIAPGLMGLMVMFFAVFRSPDLDRWRPLLMLAWGLPWGLLAVISWVVFSFYVDRYLIIVLPAFLVWLVWGISVLPRWLSRLALGGLVVGMLGGIVGISTQPQWERPAWEAALDIIRTASDKTDLLVTNSPYAEVARINYARDLPSFVRLKPGEEDALCGAGRTCWVFWEQFFITTHFPPDIGVPLEVAADLATTNVTASQLLARRETCEVYTFTHIEVWRCGD